MATAELRQRERKRSRALAVAWACCAEADSKLTVLLRGHSHTATVSETLFYSRCSPQSAVVAMFPMTLYRRRRAAAAIRRSNTPGLGDRCPRM